MNVELGIDPVTASTVAISLYRGGKGIADKMDEQAHAKERTKQAQAGQYQMEQILKIGSYDAQQAARTQSQAAELQKQQQMQKIALGVSALVVLGISIYALK